jgi:hypothetical protein
MAFAHARMRAAWCLTDGPRAAAAARHKAGEAKMMMGGVLNVTRFVAGCLKTESKVEADYFDNLEDNFGSGDQVTCE